MKTTKTLIFAALLVLTSVNTIFADGIDQKKKKVKIINVTMVQALGVPGLPAAMLQQLDEEELLGCGCSSTYTADVALGSVVYRVTGTQQEWTVFFNWGGIVVEDDINIIIGSN